MAKKLIEATVVLRSSCGNTVKLNVNVTSV